MSLDSQPLPMRVWIGDQETDIDLAALQGLWSVEQYLRLTDQTNRIIEFTDGVIEVSPVPTKSHQAILRFLFLAFLELMRTTGGDVYFAPLRVRIRPGTFREPDLVLVLDKDDPRAQESFWTGADLVAEIVSPDDPARDTTRKRAEYASAGIREYWLVNPLDGTVTVLALDAASYREHGVFHAGERATSAMLSGFSVAVSELLEGR